MLHLAALTNILLQDRRHIHAFWGRQHELLDCFGFSGVAAGTNEHQRLVCCFFFLIRKNKPPPWICRRQTHLQITASWTKRTASTGAGATSRAGFSKSTRAARMRICRQSCPWGTCAEDEFGQHRTWADEVHLLYGGKRVKGDNTCASWESTASQTPYSRLPGGNPNHWGAEWGDVLLNPPAGSLGTGRPCPCSLPSVTPWAGAATAFTAMDLWFYSDIPKKR